MARPRIPTARKELTGTLQKCRTNPDEPQPEPGVPDPDLAHLTPTGQALWPQFAKILGDLGILTVADGVGLTMLVEAFAEVVDARQELQDFTQKEGSVYYESIGKDGNVMIRAHPALARLSDADRRFGFWCGKFGLTPADRSKVSGQVQPKKNEFEDI